jgi:hypothetical protein
MLQKTTCAASRYNNPRSQRMNPGAETTMRAVRESGFKYQDK